MAKFGYPKSGKQHITETPDVSDWQNPDVLHERSDVNVRGILWFTFGLLILGIITQVLMYLMFAVFEKRAKAAEPPASPLALSEKDRLPPEPRLQVAPGFGINVEKNQEGALESLGFPVKDDRVNLQLREPQAEMKVLNKMWEQELRNGRRDPNTGAVVGMPIEQAKQKLLMEAAERLRTRTQDGEQQQQSQQDDISHGGMDVPSYQSSGRMTEKRDQ